MRAPVENYPDPDDMFAETRMSFGDHIEDLRVHLLRAVYGFLIGMVFSLFLGKPLVQFITEPVETQLRVFYDRFYSQKKQEMMAERKQGKAGAVLNLTLLLPPEMVPEQMRIKIAPGPMPRMLQKFDELAKSFDPKWEGIPPEPEDLVRVKAMIADTDNLFWEMHGRMQIIKPPQLSTLNVQEAFLVYFKVSLLAGLVLSSPWVFFQIWSFIAAGLYPHEKRIVNVYLPFSLGLFLGGAAVCQFLVLPKAIEALLWFNEWLGLQPDLRLNEWLGFAIFMPLVFGFSFQTPLAMMFLYRVGIFDLDTYRSKRRVAWFLMAIFAAIITPSTDAFSMLFLWVPMSLLYELGILMCQFQPRPEFKDPDDGDSQDLVEV